MDIHNIQNHPLHGTFHLLNLCCLRKVVSERFTQFQFLGIGLHNFFPEKDSKTTNTWKWGIESAWNIVLLSQISFWWLLGFRQKAFIIHSSQITMRWPSQITMRWAISRCYFQTVDTWNRHHSFRDNPFSVLDVHIQVQQIIYNDLMEPSGFLLKFCLTLITSRQCSACYYTSQNARVYAMNRLL